MMAINFDELKQATNANSKDSFDLFFKQVLQLLFVERVDQNEAIFAQYVNDSSFQNVVADWLNTEVYERLNRSENR
jgi:type I restriction enzyme, R subunit